jgi:hypothetical protein
MASSGDKKPASESVGSSFFKGAANAVSYLNPVGKRNPSPRVDERDAAEIKQVAPTKGESKGDAAPAKSAGSMASSTGASMMKGVKGVVHAVNYLNPMAYDHDSDSDEDSKGKGGDDRNLAEKAENSEVLKKKESALATMLRSAKNKYVEKGLEGKISIQILYGVITSGEFCTVSRTDEKEEVCQDEMKQLGVYYRRAEPMASLNLSRNLTRIFYF